MTVSEQPNRRGASVPPVMDYEGSHYRTDFWEGQGRDYEDATERLALKSLLPPRGKRLAEIGAGFGRLADLYLGYEQIVLFDYSRTLLRDAVQRWGNDPRFVFVAGNLYQLSMAEASIDTLVMVRVMHHLADVPRALAQIRRVLHGESVAVLEYANKRNLKAMARWLLGRQSWSPLDTAPVEFVALNFDFHPAWMWEQMQQAQLVVQRQLAVSHFRLPLLKQRVPADFLAKIDARLFTIGGRYPLAPSVFVRAGVPGQEKQTVSRTDPGGVAELFVCPVCRAERSLEQIANDRLECRRCETRVEKRDGVWDFKEPV